MLNFLSIFLLVYGVLAISHIVFQIILCHSDHRRQNKKAFKDFHSQYQASVSVIVPAYNEVPQIYESSGSSINTRFLSVLSMKMQANSVRNCFSPLERLLIS